jgi:RNA polymerase sigma-70 factor (ECF subfamily)
MRRPESSDRDDPARLFEGEDILVRVQEAFSGVAPEHRDVLVLRAVEQMDYESIARALQIPVGTVRSRLNRSRKAIREILRDYVPDDRGRGAQDEEIA